MFSISKWSVCFFLGTIMFIPSVQAEQPFDITYCGSGDLSILTKSKELTVASVDAKGITISNHDNKAFHNCTWHGIGFMMIKNGKRTWSSYTKFMDPDGSILIVETTMNSFHFLRGTGKWKGITGNGKGWLITNGKSITQGTIQNCRRVKGTFELPEKSSNK
ncbi:MAG: hypothetical protein SV375_00660 [Thermodesulfobacteriota bacterium]|nr:hypothetical protein [Thermodesulfobacteriota bacterium]